ESECVERVLVLLQNVDSRQHAFQATVAVVEVACCSSSKDRGKFCVLLQFSPPIFDPARVSCCETSADGQNVGFRQLCQPPHGQIYSTDLIARNDGGLL